eukprot:7080139-Prymnesium_polylepis.2
MISSSSGDAPSVGAESVAAAISRERTHRAPTVRRAAAAGSGCSAEAPSTRANARSDRASMTCN